MSLHPSHMNSMRRMGIIVALLAFGVVLSWALPVLPGMNGIANYLPLHMLLETFAVVVAMLIFAVGWHAHNRNLPGNIVLLACAFFGVGLLDFAHILSYAGMPDFVTPSNAEKGIDFWLTARSLAALALLAVVVMPWRPFISATTRYKLLAATLAATAFAYWLILFHQDALPHTFVPGKGLTAFKIAAEYLLIALNLVAVLILWQRMRKPLAFDTAAFFGALCTMALSEFLFTLYTDLTDIYNLLGHIYKGISYLFLYRAIFVSTVEIPYRQLQSSEIRLHTLYDSTSDAVMLLGKNGFFDCNKATLALFGCASKDEFCSMRPADLSPPEQPCGTDSNALAERQITTAMEQGKNQFEWMHKRADTGKIFPADVLLNRMELDGKTVLQATVRDITERKQAEQALMLKNLVFNASIAANSIAGLDGVIIEANEMFLNIWGYQDKSEVIGKPIPHFLADMDAAAGIVAELNKTGQWKGEYTARKKDGSTFHAYGLATVVRDQNGKIIGYQSSVLDITERKRAEDEQRKLYQVVEQSPSSIVITDTDANIEYVNRAFVKETGYSFAEAMGKNPRVLNSGKNPESTYREMWSCLKRGEAWRGELVNRRKDGSEYVELAVISPVRLADGSVTNYLAIKENITERKQVEEALRESGQRIRLATKAAEIGFWEWDIAANIIRWDAQMFDLYGIAQAENACIGYQDWRGAVLQEDLPKQEEILQDTIRKLGYGTREFRIRRRSDGEIRFIQAVEIVRADETGKAKWVVGTNRDITERKQREEQIERLSRIYRLLSRVNEAIVRARDEKELFAAICDAAMESGLFRFVRIGMLDEQKLAVIPAAYAGVEEGYTDKLNIRLDDERTGSGPTARAIREGTHFICHDIENDPIMEPWRNEAIKRGYRALGVFPIYEADGVAGAINVYAAETNLFTQDIIKLMLELSADVSFALDVFSEKERRKQMAEEIIQLNTELEYRVRERTSQLEAANKELEAFSYSVSHDLRAPLRSIDGFSRTLSKKYHDQLDATGQDWLERICRASQHMGHLIDDMLKLSQVTRGTLKREQVDLSKIAETVAGELKKTNPDRQVRFIIQQDLLVQADPGLMRIAMDNLLGNAWKYSGKKADAEIEFGMCNINLDASFDVDRVSTRRDALISGDVGLKPDLHSGLGEKIAFFVRDNGDGFNMDYAHKLFGAFQRLHTANEFEGTGIGLATVQRIVHRHNGKVWAEGKEGQGAKFYFTLPQRERGGGGGPLQNMGGQNG